MSKLASELLVERLIDWGVDTIFGLPGDGINGIMEGLRRHQDSIRFVLVHHEEAAAFMATAYAKATGRIGVCLATSGPGGIHLMNGLYDAKLDHVPVLAITGMQSTTQLGTQYQQEVHLDKVFMDLCVYNQMFHAPVSIPALTDIAIRTALSQRGVSHLTFPVDMQEADPEDAGYEGGLDTARPPKIAPAKYTPARIVPSDPPLRQAAEVLNAGRKVVMLVGVGARDARQEIVKAAELLGSPIVKTLPGKMVVPDDNDYVVGGLGLLGSAPSEDAMEEADTIFLVGTNFPYTRWLPTDRKAVQIELDPARLGNRIPLTTGLVGEAKGTLELLIPMLERKADRSFIDEYRQRKGRWDAQMAALENPNRDPIQPQYLMSLIDRYASDDAILSCDSGTIATWAARHWHIRANREFYLSGNLATMAPGLPYAISHGLTFPGRQSIAFVGDGGFAMLMAEFHTAVWHRVPVKICVCNNGLLGQILWEQMALGYPEHGVRFPTHMDFAPWAESCGGRGIRVEKPGDLEPAVKEWLAYDGAALLDVVVNADEAPLPPKIHYDEAKKFAESFLKGTPRRITIGSTLARDKIDQLKETVRARRR
ncbi:MAG TPA: thiamine pyrophosphate-binding protein [Acidimicrobiales bacterium]|nr:thiamine pyrophosphate-binding protein [Acidimicrobiales bacterium]